MKQQIVSAKYIMPFPGKVLKNHYITIVNGKITGIHKFHTIKTTGTQSEFISLGKSVLMPGFVNAHVHIELCSDNRPKDVMGDYFDTLDRIRQQKNFNAENPFARKHNIIKAINALIKGGCTCVGNFTSSSETAELILKNHLSGVEFVEAINRDENKSEEIFFKSEEIRKEIIQLSQNAIFNNFSKAIPVVLHAGIAPSTLYNVTSRFLEMILTLFTKENVRFCTHIAEHPDENRLFQLGDGSVYDYFLKSNNIEEYLFPPAASVVQHFSSSIEELELSEPAAKRFREKPTDSNTNTPTLIHANFVDIADVRTISELKASVVHCPRTYEYYKHNYNKKYPFKMILDNAIPLALGTDSTLTNSRLSMLDEIRLLAKSNPELSVIEILRMATVNGAKALNLTEYVGILAEGRPADIIAVEIPDDTAPEYVPTEIARGTGDVKMTMLKGEIAYIKHK